VKRSPLGIAAVVLLATACRPAVAHAAEPQVAFVVADGWVEFALTQDGRPVAGAQVRVFAATGHRYADGETGPEGRGVFPLPPGPSFRVEIKLGDRTADPILLTPVGDHVVPTEVLLSFGLAPCCKVPSRAGAFGAGGADPGLPDRPETTGSLPVWVRAAGGVAFTVLGVVILWASRRHPTTRPLPKETP
jgi:hypothetical protein